ncbi:MAG: hypothetical protein NTW07_08100, partial [candidate division Zixibacteria bacterium]|nr:hypothetical protein [candidate division Zixibacteria bacterium]
MKPSRITVGLGVVLCALGILGIFLFSDTAGIVPALIGGSLIFLGFNRSRVGTLVFGHVCILTGAYLITWGILLLPHSQPTVAHIFGRPLFWGI